jgi:acetyl-CoA/propionyl-CoA carboxylase biotin carboxyl carrier protein
VLVKAAAGGGGKGMRVVRSQGDLDEAVASAKREAASAFGDDTMLIEKYVEHGRHIEVQVIADTHGTVRHLFERDCSTQRRHQKVLEEAPAPTIDRATRERVTSAAVDLAAHVGYVNAGTVEFLLDTDTGEVYFLEMNARLQVEHPVTERVCGGLDLVEHQLRVAAGEPLSIGDVELTGHAIEARVYAEDSFGGFLPQAGTATYVQWPEGVRVDQALESGQVVSTSYDPMLGKVIAHGPDRESARQALVAALDDTAILGLTTNAGFLRTLVASDEFRDATIDTAWLDHHDVPAPDPAPARELAAWEVFLRDREDTGPFASDGFRLGSEPAPVVVELDEPVTLTVPPARRVVAVVRHDRVEVVHHGQRFVFDRPDVMGDHAAAVADGALTAPMPGTVLDVRVAEGDAVEEGQVLGVLEAMKMELSLKAPFAGTVTAVGAATGEQVKLGDALFVVEAPDDAA